jgi:NADH-quinone oxidoreductase subunit J
MLVLAASFKDFSISNSLALTDGFGTAKEVGKILFNKFLLPFEVASILFISAMVGAVILGKKSVND